MAERERRAREEGGATPTEPAAPGAAPVSSVGPPPATTAQGGYREGRDDRGRPEREERTSKDRSFNQPGGVGPGATDKEGGTGPGGAQTNVPAGGQGDSRFAEMTRAWQRQVESGRMSLDAAYAAWQKEGSISEGPGGGAGPPSATSGGGGGGGGKGGGPSAYGAGGPGGDSVEALIEKQFRGILSGEYGSFTAEKEGILLSQLRSEGRAKAAGLRSQADRDAVQRGIYRSDIALKRYREIDLSIEQQISDGENKVRLAKVEAEFNDKMKALDMAQKWLDSRRQYELGKEQIAAQREATAAQTALGYAQIEASKEIAGMQAGAARAGVGLAREQFEFSKYTYEQDRADGNMKWLYTHGVAGLGG